VLDDSAMGCVEGAGGGVAEICVDGCGLELLRRRFGDLSSPFQMEVAGYRLEGRLGRLSSYFYNRDRCNAIGSLWRLPDFDHRQNNGLENTSSYRGGFVAMKSRWFKEEQKKSRYVRILLVLCP
jgi:hypothetical protein